jgi:predicted methyltransferase
MHAAGRTILRMAMIASTMLAMPVAAQEAPHPRRDLVELRKEAKADVAIRKALGDMSRTMDARLRDDRRMVELILRAGAAKPGERVMDVASGSGYLALLFSSLVGETGHVDIHNTPGWIAQFPSLEVERQQAVITRKNIGWVTKSWQELDAPADSYDIIVLGQVWHDVILEGGDYREMAKRFFAMLKPGGRVVVEDHDAIPDMDLGRQVGLHRISHGDVTAQFLRAGFALKEVVLIESEFDNRKFNVFQPTVRGRSDRFVAVFTKPADGKPLR